MLYNNEDLKKALKSDLIYFDNNYNFNIDKIIVDSRELTDNCIFIAKKGENNDGHNFINDVLKKNDTSVVLAEFLPDGLEKNSRTIIVKNTVKAFENLAKYSRDRIKGKIIGITGSVGKTTTKEIFNHCLSKIGKSNCNIKSYNNYFGILETMVNTPSDVDFAIFEMGMNSIGEMDVIRNIIRPEIAIITNIFPIHIGNFNNEEEIAIEKSKIIDSNTKILVLNKNNKWYNFLLDKAKNIKNIRSFGTNNCDVLIKSHKIINNIAEVKYIIDNKEYTTKTTNLDYSMSYDLLPLLSLCNYLNVDIKNILDAFYNYSTYKGRNNIEKFKNITLINGSYNASINSFVSGLNLLKNMSGNRKVCIFGDILELGDKSAEIHLELVKYIKDTNINLFIAVGKYMKYVFDEIKDIKSYYFENVDSLLKDYKNYIEYGDLIFIKSSNGIKITKIIEDIEKNYERI